MATDYEKFYRQNRHGLGKPTKEFVEFFDAYELNNSMVLDVGCGQGRDAMFIARLGHTVTAIDASPSGIRDLRADAAAEGLAIESEVVDILDYSPESIFDVIVIDRTLHMLAEQDRTKVLQNLLAATRAGSHILIADESSNIAAFITVLDESSLQWNYVLERRGFLFVQRK